MGRTTRCHYKVIKTLKISYLSVLHIKLISWSIKARSLRAGLLCLAYQICKFEELLVIYSQSGPVRFSR